MNIAILIPELGGGGAERVAQILGDYYVGQGEKVFYFLQDLNIKQDYPVKGQVIKTRIRSCMEEKNISDIQRMMRLISSSLQMRRLKKQYHIDVAISFMEEFNYINILSKRRERVIVRICTILSDRKELSGFLYEKKRVHFFYSKTDKVVVMSHYAWRDMHDYYRVPGKKLIRIPNPVVECSEKRDEDEWEYGEKAFVCMGRLEGVKQHERIIRAFSYVAACEKQAKLLVLGKGPNLNYLQRLCSEFQVEGKVVFVGFTGRPAYYLKRAKAFVMASKVEGFPNSMIEAMSCGTPVITTDSPGACGEIVGKPKSIEHAASIIFCRYGILTPNMPEGKVKAGTPLTEQELLLGRVMLKVLTEDEIYKRYRKQSFKRAQMYSLDKVITKWNRLVYDK
jgi:glycosyltransferase involved in cell wall biosynthesis